MNRSFMRLLVVVSLMALGILYLLSVVFNYLSGVEATTQILLIAAIGAGLIGASYAMFYGKKVGWLLALAFVTFDAIVNVYYGVYLALLVDAVLIVLLVLVSGEYGITLYTKKPSVPVPPPSKPISVSYELTIDRERKFVRRRGLR